MSETLILLEYLFCCQFTTNDKIIDLLEDLAIKRRKCPLNNKLKTYGDNYYKLYLDVLKYFEIKNTTTTQDANIIRNWSSIRKKTIKDLIIKNYIIEVKNKYNFDDVVINNLKRDILVGLNYKNINDKNIVITNNKIVSIRGLNLYPNKYIWDYDIFKYN